MRAMILGMAALLASTSVSSASGLVLGYLVDRAELKSTRADEALAVSLYDDAECQDPLHEATLAVSDLALVERVATMRLRGMPRGPRAARLVLTVPDVPPASAYWARIEGNHVVPIGAACQPQMAPVQASLPCLRQEGTNVVVEGCNVHVRSGTGDTADTNGLGNLVIGYDDAGVAGSHNVLIGGPHEVDGYGNVLVGVEHEAVGSYNLATGVSDQVAGDGNVVLAGDHSSAAGYQTGVLGGAQNSAFGIGSVVVGGFYNMTDGDEAIVVGGFGSGAGQFSTTVAGYQSYAVNGGVVFGGTLNLAVGDVAFSDVGDPMVVGGVGNVAMSYASSVFAGHDNLADFGGTVLGGRDNAARRRGALVVGGTENRAGTLDGPLPVGLPADSFDVVVGGTANAAVGVGTLVSGGAYNEASGSASVVHGGTSNRADGLYAAVCGGGGNAAHGEASTVGGGRLRTTHDAYDWRAGELFQDE